MHRTSVNDLARPRVAANVRALKHNMRALAVAVLATLLAGCLPLPITQQPAIVFQVENPSGEPIQDALVHFVRYSIHPFVGRGSWMTSMRTDTSGSARIEGETEWQMVFLAPDGGSHDYDWAWCVEKGDYVPVSVTSMRKSPQVPVVKVILQGTNTGKGCAWREQYMGGEFVANAP